jgi:hypothetical protein
MFRGLYLFPSSSEERDTYSLGSLVNWLKLGLSKGPNTIGSLHLQDDVKRATFRYVVYSSYLEFQTMNRTF